MDATRALSFGHGPQAVGRRVELRSPQVDRSVGTPVPGHPDCDDDGVSQRNGGSETSRLSVKPSRQFTSTREPHTHTDRLRGLQGPRNNG